MKIGKKEIGVNHPVYIIGEIGINHNGSLENAIKLIDSAVDAGCDAVKFQKRNPEVAVPDHQKGVMRETPWGYITYLDYKYKVEFEKKEYDAIDKYCKEKGIDWFASCWDVDSVNFMKQYNPPAYKIASASITHHHILDAIKDSGAAILMSSGMSTLQEIQNSIDQLNLDEMCLMHTNSTYPSPLNELNLKVISTYINKYPNFVIGYSGHEVGLAPTYAAVALGAKVIERHITLDRSMWGTDQSASIEPHGLKTMVSNIRDIELSLGDGVKRVSEGEKKIRLKLRGE